ncbi:hypothetical protein SUGI_0951430 [Cryptomeria japonica]|uniref:chromophore lyase CRL, chloroplastic n=1 Tax=Cryptomeria japonica TaxID=3369 RepID=UPI002414A085|nr:chromophore lyase CRL, chloroplastic [Cryptomeria japonica]GLJ45202.1 hypothetical protein SUGI_0951430 [Cryptomeria japonica]
MGMGEQSNGSGSSSGRSIARDLFFKAVCLVGGVLLVRKLTKKTTRWEHARIVAEALSGEKFSSEQASRDPMNYFNIRTLTCPATTMADGSRVLYFEQAFWRTPEKPYRQRFCVVKPCPKDLKCDVEVDSYAIRDAEEYRNFCDRPNNQRPQSGEVVRDVAEHLTTVYLSRCKRGKRCLYEGSTPPGGFPNSWNGATYYTSDVTIHRNGEVHYWDKAYDDQGNQVWGVKEGPYEFKPVTTSNSNGSLLPLGSTSITLDQKLYDKSFVVDDSE